MVKDYKLDALLYFSCIVLSSLFSEVNSYSWLLYHKLFICSWTLVDKASDVGFHRSLLPGCLVWYRTAEDKLMDQTLWYQPGLDYSVNFR